MDDSFKHDYVTANGVKLHYVRQGSGEPVLLIHGWPGFWYEWHLNIGPLSQEFDVIAPDMRGYGYSDKPDGEPQVDYSDTAFAEDILGICDAFGFERVSLVAHDFGSMWAQRFARMHPERLRKLVLFDPVYAGIGGRWFEMPHVFNVWYQLFHQQPWAEDVVGATREATKTYVGHFLSAWSANKTLWTDEELERYADAYSQPGALRGGFNCYRASYRGAGNTDGNKKIETPTLVLWADSDPIIPFAWSDRIPEFFTDAVVKKIEGAGHFMMRETPDRVNAEIARFLAS